MGDYIFEDELAEVASEEAKNIRTAGSAHDGGGELLALAIAFVRPN